MDRGTVLRTLEGHSSGVRAIQFDARGVLVSGSLDGTVKIVSKSYSRLAVGSTLLIFWVVELENWTMFEYAEP